MLDLDALAQEIRRVDGNHDLGAGALAEALMPFISRALQAVGPEPATWEYFCDRSYFDMWCVRQKDAPKVFGDGYHVMSEAEAKSLAAYLNSALVATPPAELVVETDWINYRPLAEGEIIHDGDECLTDSHLGWQPAANTVGSAAPDPSYTAHRMYRRPLATKPAVKDDETVVLPRLTDDIIRAACKAHFGTDNADGVCVTVRGHDWTFRDAFKRMWSGARAALAAKDGRS